jgi:hypothetical protein
MAPSKAYISGLMAQARATETICLDDSAQRRHMSAHVRMVVSSPNCAQSCAHRSQTSAQTMLTPTLSGWGITRAASAHQVYPSDEVVVMQMLERLIRTAAKTLPSTRPIPIHRH